jgi:hypothetical protein
VLPKIYCLSQVQLTAGNPLELDDDLSTRNNTHNITMGKRAADAIEDGNQAYLKRQKIGTVVEKPNSAIEIHSGKQLRQLLAFDQDPARSKNGKSPYLRGCLIY